MALTAALPPRALLCPRCRAPLPEFTVRPDEETCGSCGTSFAAVAFAPPAPSVRPAEAAFADPAAAAFGATPCARHEHHAAVANCSRCGVFVCELCRIPLEGRELCPDCFDRLIREGSFSAVETHFLDASGLSLALAVLGFVTCYFGIFFGPAAIALAIKGLGQKRAWREIGGRTAPILGIVLGAIVTVWGVAMIAILFAGLAGVAGLGGMKKP